MEPAVEITEEAACIPPGIEEHTQEHEDIKQDGKCGAFAFAYNSSSPNSRSVLSNCFRNMKAFNDFTTAGHC